MTTRAKMKAVSEGTQLSATPTTFEGMIAKELASMTGEMLANVKQDTGKGANVSSVLSELFMWNWIRKRAESQYDKLMEQARESGIIGDTSTLAAGNHVVAESRHFVTTAHVSEPVKRFSPEALSLWAYKAYKIPVILMREQIEKAKTPTKPTVRITIVERQ